MRRKDREVLDEVKIDKFIRNCDCCRIGFYDKENDEVYIVPLNFGYSNVDNKRVFYFHGAKEGRKIELISKTKKVSFEMDSNHELIVGKMACNYSERYQSVMGTGLISFVEDKDEKIAALNEIMFQSTGKKDWDFPEPMLNGVVVFKIEVTSLSANWGLIILMAWQQIGYMMIIYIAGLQAVPEDMLEAARIDGANRWQTLWRVTIPNVMPSITICMFLSLTNGFKLFDQNLALTAGRPFQQLGNGETIKTTEMLALNIVNAFGTSGGGNRGVGQAKAVIFFIVVAAISIIQLQASRRKEVQQ